MACLDLHADGSKLAKRDEAGFQFGTSRNLSPRSDSGREAGKDNDDSDQVTYDAVQGYGQILVGPFSRLLSRPLVQSASKSAGVPCCATSET